MQKLQDDPLQASVEKLMPLEQLVQDEEDKVLRTACNYAACALPWSSLLPCCHDLGFWVCA